MRLLESVLIERLANPDYCDSEDAPSVDTINFSLDIIRQLRDRDAAEADVSFFAGEIHIDWDIGNRHVIAMFMPSGLMTYWGRIENNRVVEHGCKATTLSELNERLDWAWSAETHETF